MKSFLKTLIVSACVASFSLFPLLVQADIDITGPYKCMGKDPFTKNDYSIDLVISQTGGTYHFKWGTAGKEFSGTGLFSKSVNNIVAVEFWNPQNENSSGVVVYQVQPDGTLNGDWAVADQALVGVEICKKEIQITKRSGKSGTVQ